MNVKIKKVIKRLEDFGAKHKRNRLPRQEKRLFETKYAYFRSDGREFVIKTPQPPGLWANFLTNGKYTAFLTPTGGGYSWDEESGYNRVLREHPITHLVEDRPGRYIFIKDMESKDFWSATYQPVGKADKFEAIHSLGWTSSSTIYKNIDSQVTYFVPPDASHEVWVFKIKNNGKTKRRLKFFTYCELVLGRHQPDLLENSFQSFFSKGGLYKNCLVFNKTSLETKENIVESTYDKIGFFTTSEKFTEYELSLRDFIGFGRSLASPQAVAEDYQLNSCSRAGENLIGCVSFEAILAPGAKKEFYFALGAAHNLSEIIDIKRSLKKSNIDKQFQNLNNFWSRYIKKVWIETPDPGLNIWFNYWLKYQTHFNAHWSEMDSFYLGGSGTFGFRDTAQHIYGVLPFEKEIYLKQLRFLLSHQFPNGNVPHSISIFKNLSIEAPHSDDPCWLVFAVLNYVEETGDLKFLKENIPFADTRRFGPGHKGSVLKHIIRATEYSLSHSSERGIASIRIADWNDALSSGFIGKGESFMVAGLLGFNLKRLIGLLKKMGRDEKADEYTFAYERLGQAVDRYGWDGEWFIRATDDHNKKPIGSAKNQRGKIFLDSNTWLCISGLAGKNTNKTLKSLWKYLMTKYGALLFNPAYQSEDKKRGVISQFVPGSKENAAVFLHPNAWFLIGLSQASMVDHALELLQRINPVYRYFHDAEVYKVEPYVLSEFIFGNESDKFGEGSYTWVTGSAEWFLRGILDYFLGLRPEYDKLVFEPKVPKNWSFKVMREFQGKKWEASYDKGIKSLKSK